MIITEYIRNVDRAILNTVFENTVRRVKKCLETCNFSIVISWKRLFDHPVYLCIWYSDLAIGSTV